MIVLKGSRRDWLVVIGSQRILANHTKQQAASFGGMLATTVRTASIEFLTTTV